MPRRSKVPEAWASFYIGRRVQDSSGSYGVVKYPKYTLMCREHDAQNITTGLEITTWFVVLWDEGSEEVVDGTELAHICTDEFVKEEWVMPEILKKQEAGWDEPKAALKASKPLKTPREKAAPARDARQQTPRKVTASGTRAVPLGELLKRKEPGKAPAATSKRARTAASSQTGKAGGSTSAGVASLNLNIASEAATSPSYVSAAEDHVSTSGGPEAAGGDVPTKRSLHPGRSAIHVPLLKQPKCTSQVLKVAGAKGGRVHVFQYDCVEVDGGLYRVYCADLILAEAVCLSPGDKDIDTWKVKGKYKESEEYQVECVVAERAGGGEERGSRQYLLKYQGFELDVGPECWLPAAEVEQIAAHKQWRRSGKAGWLAGMEAVKEAAAGRLTWQ